MRVIAFAVLLLAWDANAYRLPHRSWKSEEGGESVGNAKSVGDGSVEGATDAADENSGNFWAQHEESDNTESAKASLDEVLGTVMKERSKAAGTIKQLNKKIIHWNKEEKKAIAIAAEAKNERKNKRNEWHEGNLNKNWAAAHDAWEAAEAANNKAKKYEAKADEYNEKWNKLYDQKEEKLKQWKLNGNKRSLSQ